MFLETLGDWSVRGVLPPFGDVSGFLLDFFFTVCVNFDFETVHVFLPLLWNIGDLDVGLEGSSEFMDLFSEGPTSSGVLEFLSGFLDALEGLVGEQVLIGLIVLGSPVGGSKVLVVIRHIIELVGKLLHGLVVEVDGLLGVLDVFVKDSANVLPLLDELLTGFRCEEFLVKLVNTLGSTGLGPFF